jgi:hypothetical protein
MIRSVKLPKSFVAIDLSEKVPDAFERAVGQTHTKDEGSDGRGRSEDRKEEADSQDLLPIADEKGNVADPAPQTELDRQISPASLPPPALDG